MADPVKHIINEALIYDDKIFESFVYNKAIIKGREFQSCTFKNCDLSENDFSNNKFIDCIFEGCNLSLVKLSSSTLNNVVFKNCKLLGVNFSECHSFLFTVFFECCNLDYASFMGKKMANTKFIRSSLKEATFSGANISGSIFDQTELSGAVFNRTDLSGANFVNALNYSIDPELNIMKKASFSLQGVAGLLSKYQINIV